MKTYNIEIIVSCASNRINPAPRPSKHIPGATNPRSTAFICGLFSAKAPEIINSLFIKQIHLSLRPLRSLRWCL
jgi:hypothetical protein